MQWPASNQQHACARLGLQLNLLAFVAQHAHVVQGHSLAVASSLDDVGATAVGVEEGVVRGIERLFKLGVVLKVNVQVQGLGRRLK